eukprot:TRINITY_DN19814_c0_g1_i1.p1 TRINITY_DN19814_c0_g1~~TRINITY_DN19814_c0_g1_i1.p1  ORF type:complete len:200 (-),score=10.14 TRINITY_DN19814_c0_g1_i1:39-638(-)
MITMPKAHNEIQEKTAPYPWSSSSLPPQLTTRPTPDGTPGRLSWPRSALREPSSCSPSFLQSDLDAVFPTASGGGSVVATPAAPQPKDRSDRTFSIIVFTPILHSFRVKRLSNNAMPPLSFSITLLSLSLSLTPAPPLRDQPSSSTPTPAAIRKKGKEHSEGKRKQRIVVLVSASTLTHHQNKRFGRKTTEKKSVQRTH